MKVPGSGVHLTYCLNVHPGETPEQLSQAVLGTAPRVFDAVRERGMHDGPFGLGLWLSDQCARFLECPSECARFAAQLRQNGLYVLTINGFPFGAFHGRRVKEKVYLPDWSEAARLEHTLRLARIFTSLPHALNATISTVPITYRAWATAERTTAAVANFATALAELARIEQSSGLRIQLALEPEPDCLLDDAASTVQFFDRNLRPELARRFGAEPGEQRLQRYAGVCLDCSHMAVVFDEPAHVLDALRDRAIPVAKIHLSAAIRSRFPGPAPEALRNFVDTVYFHQTRVRSRDGIHAFPDLQPALNAPQLQGEWRVHYHVPLIWEGEGELESTRDCVSPAFLGAALADGVEHFEVETYTLPLFDPEVGEAPETTLAEELCWAERHLNQAAGPHTGEIRR